MAAASPPITEQIRRSGPVTRAPPHAFRLDDVTDALVFDRHGVCRTFESLFRHDKAIIVFVRHFLCYACEEYVKDLAKISARTLQESRVRLVVIGQASPEHIQDFCSLTSFSHEMYVDPNRHIYRTLGMRRGETQQETPSTSPHVRSGALWGGLRSVWRAVTGPAFDFQGDPLQQGGALILGPGPQLHFSHLDMNRLDHVPIAWLLELAGLHAPDFSGPCRVIHV